MPPDKAKFEVRDISPAFPKKDSTELKYMGEERRRQNRRSGVDRRDEVRFEIGKDDRRRDLGRRKDDKTGRFW